MTAPRSPGGQMSQMPAERTNLIEAMERLLSGEPQHSNGDHTIVALAAEANVARARIYEQYPDVVVEFRARVGHTASPRQTAAMNRQLAAARDKAVALASENVLLRKRIDTLLTIIAELTLAIDSGKGRNPSDRTDRLPRFRRIPPGGPDPAIRSYGTPSHRSSRGCTGLGRASKPPPRLLCWCRPPPRRTRSTTRCPRNHGPDPRRGAIQLVWRPHSCPRLHGSESRRPARRG